MGTRRADAVDRGGLIAALAIALSIATLAAGASFAWHVAFGTYAPYDDEGYFQAALALLEGGARLYDDVVTPYGPAWLATREVAHEAFGAPVSTDGVRLALIPVWIASALACAGLAGLCSHDRSLRAPLALVVFVCAVVQLRALANEPGHPQDVALLFALVALLSAVWSQRQREDELDPRPSRGSGGANGARARSSSRAAWALAGASWALASLTKVNVGAASGLALVAHALRGRRSGIVALVAGIAFPWALMHARLDEPECIALALASNVAWGTVLATRWRSTSALEPRTAAREPGSGSRSLSPLVVAAASALVVLVATVAWLAARRTSVGALVSAVLVGPLRFTSEIERALDVPPLGMLSALASLGVFVVVRRSGRSPGERAKLAFGTAATALAIVEPGAAIAFALPWSWIALGVVAHVSEARRMSTGVPHFEHAHYAENAEHVENGENGENGEDAARVDARLEPRTLVALTAALFPLQAFPVSGTQLVLGALPLVVLGLVSLADGLARAGAGRARPVAWVSAVCALAVLATSASSARTAYLARDDLSLEGASRTRFDELWGARQACLAATLRASDAAFVSVRGDHSLHAWSGRPPPSRVLVSHAFGVLSSAQHAELVDDCRASAALLVLDQPGRWNAATRAGVPLLAYVDAELVPGGRLRTDVLMHRRDAPPPRWSRCAFLATPAALELDVRLPPGVSLARARRAQIVDAERGVVLADSADRARGLAIDVARAKLSLDAPLPRERAAFACVRLLDANGVRTLTLPIVVGRD